MELWKTLNVLLCRSLLLLLVTASLSAATSGRLPQANAELVGMSAEHLARIGTWLEEVVENGQAAGVVTLVARHGKVVHYSANGTRGMDVPDPMPLDALFDIASMTKPLTAVAALMLYEEGRITLGDSVSAHISELKSPTVLQESGDVTPAEREMTVRHLFTHSSGVRDPRGGRAETGNLQGLKLAAIPRPARARRDVCIPDHRRLHGGLPEAPLAFRTGIEVAVRRFPRRPWLPGRARFGPRP